MNLRMPIDHALELSTHETPNIERKPSSLRYYQEGVPVVSETEWELRIDAGNGSAHTLSYDDLLRLPCTAQFRRMVCVCNWTIKRNWAGVLLKDLLNHVGAMPPPDNHVYLKQTSIGTPEKGSYESWIDLHGAIRRDAILAYAVDGKCLPSEQGFPVRFIDFGLYNYKNVKGLAQLEITAQAELGHWEAEAGYPLDGTVKPKRYWCVDARLHRFTAVPGEVTDW